MKTSEKIKELELVVNNAITANAEGRQMVANSCKELYNLIEKDVYDAGAEWMLNGMYADLTSGNFSEPFMCEKKKSDFLAVKRIYEEKIMPRL